MTFQLKLRFVGLCLFVVHPTKRRIAVVLPDGRLKAPNQRHLDGSLAEPHVGYISVDSTHVPGGSALKGQFVRRIDREDLRLSAGPVDNGPYHQMIVPSFDDLTDLKLRPEVFSTESPALMRTFLYGGQLSGASGSTTWAIENPFGKAGHFCEATYDLSNSWETTVSEDTVSLLFIPFDGRTPSTLTLVPAGKACVEVTVANLCCSNPLGWEELGGAPAVDDTDDDFRWYYDLLVPHQGTYAQLLNGGSLPVPKIQGVDRGQPPGCTRAKITAAF